MAKAIRIAPYDRRSGEQHGKEEETTSEEHRRKLLLTETIAQHAGEPQEGNPRELSASADGPVLLRGVL